ncbi:hypothetical protein ACFQZZ_15570 [Nocardia sp. GCM10030253]|uniref:DUF7373 family lipoprotein n=1 Tax=Nocardia sp. GCM10030253 TaxID=3273404 RepID=UPI003631E0B1
MRRSDTIRALVAVLVAATALAVTSGCAVQGNPLPATPDPRSLDIGSNSSEPLVEPRNDNESYGRTLESIRMAEVMIDPVEADPALGFEIVGGIAPLPTPAKATRFLAKPVRAVLERHGMLAGFTVGGSDKEELDALPMAGRARLLTVLLLRFPDAAAAQQAAREIDAVDAAVSPDNVAVQIAGHPSALGHWRPTLPTLAATIAHESFVVTMLIGHTSPDLTALSGLARKAFDAQLPRLREFQATAPDKLATLPLDRDRMLARMLPELPGRWPFPAVITKAYDKNAGWKASIAVTGVVFGPRGSHLWSERGKNLPIELVAVNGLNSLVRFADARAARTYISDHASVADPALRPVPGPEGVIDSRCAEQLDVPPQLPLGFTCEVMYGRYVALTRGRDLKDAHQQAAAQLALLVNGE